MTGAFPQRPRLRLVEKPPLAHRRSLFVRINVFDGRSAFGRSRAFRLSEGDLWNLVEIATRMERWS